MPDLVLIEQVGPVAVVTLNRPERHNSLIPALLEELLTGLEALQGRATARALVLQANGRSFSTGGDVRGFYEHLDKIEAYAGEIVGLLNQVILSLVKLPIPVVAAVQGIVTGGSIGLVLASDIVLLAPDTGFTPYYSVVGFSPDGGWTAMLPSIIGPKRTAATLIENRTITAEQALAWGLANRITARERIQEEALLVAQGTVAMKAGSLRHTKQLLFADHDGLERRLERERSHFVQQITTPEARQGILDFLAQISR